MTFASSPATDPPTYVVQEGDMLWDIAARALGDPTRWREIWEAHANRAINDGATFTDPEFLRPGWVLHLPAVATPRAAPRTTPLAPTSTPTARPPATLPATPALAPAARALVPTYVVRSGDTLSSIAARLLGSAARWPEIWEINRNRSMADGRVFSDPNLIHPGWELLLARADRPLAGN